jgi:hypothetical protein
MARTWMRCGPSTRTWSSGSRCCSARRCDNSGHDLPPQLAAGRRCDFRNWVGSAVRAEPELGFFRLTLTADFIVEPAGSAGGGQPDLLWRTSRGKRHRTRAAAPNPR